MTLKDISSFNFVRVDKYNRYIINPRKASNTFTLEAVLSILQRNGYKLTKLFDTCITATK